MDQVIDTFDQLSAWGEIVKKSFSVEGISALAEDEAVFKWLSTADIAWQGMCAAQDHLKGFRAWVNTEELFPIATFSLLRGALVGGVIAAYVLIPDKADERIARSLAVSAEWYKNHQIYGREISDYAINPERHSLQIQHSAHRAQQVKELRKLYQHPKLNMTDVIERANAELWPFDQGRALATKGIWRAGSGDAHALGWSVLTRAYDMTALDEGMGVFVSGPSSVDVANAYLCAYDFTAYAFHRFAELTKFPIQTEDNRTN